MKTKAYITLQNKKYVYTLERGAAGTVRMVVPAARIDQEFLPEDIAHTILDLPNLITAEQRYEKKHSEVIRFRISGEEKVKIEHAAIKKGYTSVSSYLRDIALKG